MDTYVVKGQQVLRYGYTQEAVQQLALRLLLECF